MKTKSAAEAVQDHRYGQGQAAAAGKRHGMIKRSNEFIRDARGTMVLADADAKIIEAVPAERPLRVSLRRRS